MKNLILWLEGDNKRLRKVLTIFTAVVWLLAVITSYIFAWYDKSTMDILSLTTAQFATALGFYMATRADTD